MGVCPKNNITLLIVANFVPLETAKSAHRIRCDDDVSHIIRMHSMPTDYFEAKENIGATQNTIRSG